jgi:hypothetical protein
MNDNKKLLWGKLLWGIDQWKMKDLIDDSWLMRIFIVCVKILWWINNDWWLMRNGKIIDVLLIIANAWLLLTLFDDNIYCMCKRLWKMNDERWKMKDERWKMKDEWWKMKDEWWMKKDYC